MLPTYSLPLETALSLGLALGGWLLLTVTAGFIAGVRCAPAIQEWLLRRTSRSAHHLYAAIALELARCERLCRQLAEWTGTPLGLDEWSRIDELVRQLQDTCSKLRAAQNVTPEMDCVPSPSSGVLEWKRQPCDPTTQVPDRSTLEENLQRLLAISKASQQPAGVLLVSVDKADHLYRRFGAELANALECRLAAVLIKASRHEDLVCQAGPHTFAVLMPAVSPLEGARLAERLRSAVREHRYRSVEFGVEAIVTASFGFAACFPGDPHTLVLDRANAALIKSRHCGRNQLHIHNGMQPLLCRVG